MHSCLLDTNVLLRSTKRAYSDSRLAMRAVDLLNISAVPLFYTHQKMAELWNVITRPINRNGFGLSLAEAESELREIEAGMNLLPETQDTYRLWRSLLLKYKLQGVQVHDARLVATMQAHGIVNLLTFDISDFERFAEIETFHPQNVLDQFE